MGVYLRQKKIKNGKISLYLDFFPAIRKEDGSFTRREFLGKYIYAKPKNEGEREINKVNWLFAKEVKLKREKQIVFEKAGVFNPIYNKKDFIEYFRKLTEQRIENENNYSNWLSTLNYLEAFTKGKCKMEDLTEDFCNNFKMYLLTTDKLNSCRGIKLAQNSALSYFSKFSAAVKAAFNAKYLSENPLNNVKGIKQVDAKREFLTNEELQKVANAECDLPLLKTAALFSGLTGLRWSDMCRLKWGDIQYTENKEYFIHITQKKTKRVIIHPISTLAVKLIGEQGFPEEKIFHGLKYSAANNEKLKKWIHNAGINKKITLHNFRHTYATLLLEKGAQITTVSEMLGHTNIRTTMPYAKTQNQAKINAAKLINIQI